MGHMFGEGDCLDTGMRCLRDGEQLINCSSRDISREKLGGERREMSKGGKQEVKNACRSAVDI